jgi:Esterase PHB depolymerase
VADSIRGAPTEVRQRSDQSIARCPERMSEHSRQLEALPSWPAPTLEPTRGVELSAQFITGSYTNQVGTRAYKLYIPSAYSGQTLPLVVVLHGCRQNPDDFAAGTGMNGIAEKYPCFVVYPAQAGSESVELLELVQGDRSEARSGRARAHCRHYAPDHRHLLRPRVTVRGGLADPRALS